MFANVDWAPYYKSAKKLRNVYIRKQGGVKKCHGTIFHDFIEQNHNLAEFVGRNGEKYLIVFTNEALKIYRRFNNFYTNLVHTITISYTDNEITELKYCQSENILYLVHKDSAPNILTHNGNSDIDWTFGQIVFKNQPAFDFRKDYYTSIFEINDNSVGIGRTLSCNTAVFDLAHVGGLFLSIGLTATLGVARITGFTSSTSVTVDVINPFDDSLLTTGTGVSGASCFLGEIAFSEDRGWPQSVCLYEGRLTFGGTTSLPSTIFCSKINDLTNFDQGSSNDDDAIIYTIGSNKFDKILNIVADKTLQIFCENSEFSTMQSWDEPFTASNSSIRIQTKKGSEDVTPVILDDQTFYVKKGGQEIMSLIISGADTYYKSISASKYASILINNPVSMAALIGSNNDDSDYLFVVNEDGSIATLQSDLDDQILGWSLRFTGQDATKIDDFKPNQGKFLKVISVDNNIYCTVQRYVNGQYIYTLEEFSFDVKMDSTIYNSYSSPQTVVSNLNSLEGVKVWVIGDGFILQDRVVTNGSITIERPSKEILVGIELNVYLETVPVYIIESGRLYLPKRMVRSFVSYYKTNGLIVGGSRVPEMYFGNNVLNLPVPLLTGSYQGNEAGWDLESTLVITQSMPVDFLILGIGFEVEI
jgi:hypothetical protein